MSRTQILALLALSFGSALPLACSHNFDYFSAAGGMGGSSGTSSSSGTGGSTGGCTSNAACDDGNPCTTDACSAATGKCTHTDLASGTTVPGYVETPGDCKTEQCMGGEPTFVADNTNLPTNTNPCVTLSCANMAVVTTDVMQGQSCGTMGLCNGSGTCVGCNSATDCPAAGTCMTAMCNANVCSNANDPARTACNAGGTLCDGNGNCVQCLINSDCTASGASFICTAGQCVNSCTDGMKDGTETGNDCGGACPPCGNGSGCNVNADCQTGDCQGGTCVGRPDGNACMTNAQCASMACVNTGASSICCSSMCTSTCTACLATLTGKPDGMCANVEPGKAAVGGQCAATTPCGDDGNCNGNGACEQAPATTACGTASCSNSNGTETPTGLCSGTGTCNPGTPVSCMGFMCNNNNTVCRTTCNVGADTGCATGFYCAASGANGACTAQLATGSPCTSNEECLNGMCLTPDAGTADGGADGGTDAGSGMECN